VINEIFKAPAVYQYVCANILLCSEYALHEGIAYCFFHDNSGN